MAEEVDVEMSVEVSDKESDKESEKEKPKGELHLSQEEIEEKKREEENAKEIEDIGESKWFIWYMNFIWLGTGAVFLWFFAQIIEQHISAVQQPSSTVLIDTASSLPLPKVAICNWNQNGSPVQPIPPEVACDTCNLTLISCSYFGVLSTDPSFDCSSLWRYRIIQTIAGQFSCYIFNADPNNPIYSNTTGYSGSYATVWQVDLLNATDPPINRGGLQASFVPNDNKDIDPMQIYNEYRFAQIGQDAFFALQLVITTHQEITNTSDPNFNVTRFDTVSSAVTLLTDPAAAAESIGFVGVSFAFQTLNSQSVLFNIGYTLNNLFGDFAGMIGTLMGLDAIKVSSALPLMFLAAKNRVIGPLRDHFNG